MKLDVKILDEAKGCSTCKEWHKHCNAECCTSITLSNTGLQLNKLRPGYIVRAKVSHSEDLKWYYKLHGCTYDGDVINIPLLKFRREPGQIRILRKCDNLNDDLSCKGHPDNKPDICKEMTEERPEDPRWVLTPNCLYRYKKYLREKEESYGNRERGLLPSREGVENQSEDMRSTIDERKSA